MNYGVFGFPMRERCIVVLAGVFGSGVITTRKFSSPTSGWAYVTGIGGGGAGDASYGGAAGEWVMRQAVWLEAGVEYTATAGRGGVYAVVAASETTLASPAGTLVYLAGGATAGDNPSTLGGYGYLGFENFPTTLVRVVGSGFLGFPPGWGTGGGRQYHGAPGAIAIELPGD